MHSGPNTRTGAVWPSGRPKFDRMTAAIPELVEVATSYISIILASGYLT